MIKGLRTEDLWMFAGLAMLAVFIWLRDLAWISTADDTLPILISLPLFYWMGSPWKMRDHPLPFSQSWIVSAAAAFLAGTAFNSTLALTIGWNILLWVWISSRISEEQLPPVKKLMILPLMAFPWVALDADRVGWWFRLSGAWASAHIFSWLGLNVQQEGTNLVVNGLPISVEIACAGLNTLQSMLIAGTMVNFMLLGNTSRYWWNIPVLVGMSWVANTIRIILVSLVALIVNPQFAMGPFHQIGGWAILFVMFALCWLIFYWQEPAPEKKT
jgi:exosortase/archaeosortase family protein